MISQHLASSRYLRKARAAHVARLLAAGALVTLPVACGNSDESAFTTVQTVAPTAAVATDAPATAAPVTEAPATEAPATEAPATEAPATEAPVTQAPATEAPAATTAPAGDGGTAVASEMAINFTYQASGGGRVLNPYIAVWVEDANGNLVQTVAIWYQQDRKGAKWLSDLSSWYSVSGGDAATSSATRAPGDYSVVWDGSMADGTAAPAGTYTVFVEAAREHGPHSITSVEVNLDGSATTTAIPDNEELLGLSLTTA